MHDMIMNPALEQLGLVPCFVQQLGPDEVAHCRLMRVVAVHRSEVGVHDGSGERRIGLSRRWQEAAAEDRPTVGDWVVVDAAASQLIRVLERKSVFRRLSAGSRPVVQLIAANVDTLFVVTSCNEEFKESRLERYVALAAEAGVQPVVVLTKIDLVDDPGTFVARARAVRKGLAVEAVNALDATSLGALTAWITPGSTITLVGSSGVGKSTLINSLCGTPVLATGAIRAQDARGRHTTTQRSLHRLPGGGLLIDVPGMRELKVADLGTSLQTVFADIGELAAACRYADCRHESEPGCMVRAALADGRLDERRWRNYTKLLREEAHNSRSLAEQRSRERRFGQDVKRMMAFKRDQGLKL